MKIRAALATVLAGVLLGAVIAPASFAGPKAKSGPQVVGTDVANDWGSNIDAGLAPVGTALGQELVEASLEMVDTSTVNFIIKTNGLPSTGGLPEITRYGWEFTVDGDLFQLTGNFTEYLRGVCNPLVEAPCPRDPGSAPFFLRQGACVVAAELDCRELALIHATFDATAATITIPVPLEALSAKPGSKIGPGTSASYGGTVYAVPQANISNAYMPFDTMIVTSEFVVPSGKKAKK